MLAKGVTSGTTTVKNIGNQAVRLFFQSTLFTFDPAKYFVLAAGAMQTLTVTAKASGTARAVVTPDATPLLCTTPPLVVDKAE